MQPCHKGCVLMIIKECPKIATCLSIYLSKDSGFFFFNDVCVSTEKYKFIERVFFFIPKKAIFLVSPLLFIITFYYFHDDVIIVMSVAGYLRFPFSVELFFNTYYDGCMLQCRINCAVNDIGMKWNR